MIAPNERTIKRITGKRRTKNAAELLTDETAAAYIGGIEPRTVRSFRMSRGLPFVRITPKVVRIRRADLDRWLARHAVAITRGGQ